MSSGKIFNDSVHGHMKMDSVLVEIIDTPEVQRLRNIKQLGGGYYVFPGASHNRFEHSLGVAHLAGELIQSLMDNQKNLGITYKDKLCVQIAALCHDLGHGPYSHLFEDFMKLSGKKWTHEEQSIIMFNKLIKGKKNKLELTEDDFWFIRELIYGPNPPTNSDSDEEPPKPSAAAALVQSVPKWPYKGRPEKKAFLYYILANKLTGIDVDKMDYFSRDCLHLGMKNNFSHERFVMFARVCKDETGRNQICMRDKEALNMYEIFHVRYLLHNNVYHHRVTEAIQTMIVDALLKADKHFRLKTKGEHQKTVKISEAVDHPELYLRLTDNILQEIMLSSEPGLGPAKKIIERIETRDLYKFIGGNKFQPEELKETDVSKIKEMLQGELKKWLDDDLTSDLKKLVNIKNIRVKCANLNYGMDSDDPIEKLRFYRKNDPDTAVKLDKKEISHLLPEKFAEINVMLFYTGPNDSEEKKQIPEKLKGVLEKFWARVK